MSAGRCLLKNGILWDTKKMVDILIDDERICMEFVAHFQMNFCTDLYWAG